LDNKNIKTTKKDAFPWLCMVFVLVDFFKVAKSSFIFAKK
jgi:hypothetical protein